MIGRLGQGFDKLNISSGIYGRTEQHFLEQVSADEAGAGEGCQQAAGFKEAHGEPIKVFVASGGSFDVALAMGKFGWVEDDDIETLVVISVVTEQFKGIGHNVFILRPFMAVKNDVFLSLNEDIGRTVNTRYFAGPGCRGVEGKAARVGKEVEDFFINDMLWDGRRPFGCRAGRDRDRFCGLRED